jgi:hypothetical protein
MNCSKFVVSFIILLFCLNLFAGPFGLEMGMSLEDIGGKSIKMSDGNYGFKELPKSHSAFDLYLLQIAPKGGLYDIMAVGKFITCNPNGFQLKKQFDDLKETLGENYGKCLMVDTLSAGSIWDKPGDWMMGLSKKHRTYKAIWGEESFLPPDLKIITLEAYSTSLGKGFIFLRYGFINSDSCSTEKSAEENSAL